MTLDQLGSLGSDRPATVIGLDCTGPARRRLLDLGLVPGTTVSVSLTSPLGDPVAYAVRGSTIALRRVQARTVQIAAGIEAGDEL
jgi:Fe2+ transport system protein FeoA